MIWFIVSILFQLNLRIKSLKNQLDISESELDLAQTEKRKIQEENLDKDKEIQVRVLELYFTIDGRKYNTLEIRMGHQIPLSIVLYLSIKLKIVLDYIVFSFLMVEHKLCFKSLSELPDPFLGLFQ